MKGHYYWMVVKQIITRNCRRKGIPLNNRVMSWIDRRVEIQKERWEMKLSRSVMV